MRLAVTALVSLNLGLLAQDYDLVIRGARIVDGTGAPWYRADVAVKDGSIAKIGALPNATGKRLIDAQERVLSPGFIDIHTHAERREFRPGIEDFPDALNFLLDGVTTIVTGNCGNSPIDLASWLRERSAGGTGPNVASLVGHGSIRRAVMGTAERAPTAAELRKMEALVEQAMRDGAFGLSTGLIYVPGTYANTAEIVALAKVAAQFDGIYSTHIRDEGNGVIQALTEAATVGQQAGIPVQVSHLKVASKRLWGESDRVLGLLDKFRTEGIDIAADQYPFDRASTQLETTLPSWALAGGLEELKQRLRDPATKTRIVQAMNAMVREQGFADYSFATVASCAFDHNLEGKTITAINRLQGRTATLNSEIETILQLVQRGTMQMVFHWMDEQDVERIMRNANVAVASDGYVIPFGEGVPHPRSYATRAKVLARYVRDRKTLSLEDAIRRMTSLPARIMRLKNRGLIKTGFAADMLLFDPAKVQDASTFARPHQYSQGFEFVVVNGKLVVDEGKPMMQRAGQVLRRQ